MRFLRVDIKRPENTLNRACSSRCWWGTGTLTMWQTSPKKRKTGWKEGVQALYRVYLVQFPYLELFCVKGHFFTFGRNQFHTFLGEISEKKTPCRSSHDHGKTSQFFLIFFLLSNFWGLRSVPWQLAQTTWPLIYHLLLQQQQLLTKSNQSWSLKFAKDARWKQTIKPFCSSRIFCMSGTYVIQWSNHCPALSLTDWLTHWCFGHFIDVTLADEMPVQKLLTLVTMLMMMFLTAWQQLAATWH